MEQQQAENGLRWSGIVFAKRKLTVVALERLLVAVPALAFLKAQAIMGHGGRLAATSLTTKACPGPCMHQSWRSVAYLLCTSAMTCRLHGTHLHVAEGQQRMRRNWIMS